MDPIKPKQLLTKKPNFKKERLDDEFIKVGLAALYGQITGSYTREVDTSIVDWNQDIFLPLRDEERNGNGRIYNINVGELNDGQHFIDRMRTSMMIPQQYFGNQETEVVDIQQIRTQQEVENLYGQLDHPIGISSRRIQNTDESMDLLSYDLAINPSSPSEFLGGGEQMMYSATTTMVLHSPRKKKTFIGRVKQFFLDIYKRWKV